MIDGAVGGIVAPAAVYPHNPWARGIMGARAITPPKSGRLFPAKVSDVRDEDVVHEGEVLQTTAFRIDTGRRT